jgi:hypothetical protein
VVERLRQLAVGDLARADEDDRLEAVVGRRAVDGQRRRSVARAGAGDPAGTDHPRVGERGGHAVVLEAARGVHPFVLEPQAAGRQPDVLPHLIGHLKQRLPLADGHHQLGGRERKQLAESPDAREVQRVVAV